MIQISVVVCTYNRAAVLMGALESLVQQTLNKALYEIIVVDNASMDSTSQVVQEFCVRHGDCNLEIVCEPRQGLGYARNTGFRCARGDYVAFVDDDARADRGWLKLALDCFEYVKPTPVVVGGPILPFYDISKPDWFRDEFEIRTWGDRPRFLKKGESFSGSNMIFEKEALDNGGFNVNVGMKGEYISTGEETSLFERMWEHDGEALVLYYSPQLVVFHLVPGYKMTLAYQLRRAFAKGQARYVRNVPGTIRGRLGIIRMIGGRIRSLTYSALAHTREHTAIKGWVVENLVPIVVQLGHLSACLGIIVPIRQSRR